MADDRKIVIELKIPGNVEGTDATGGIGETQSDSEVVLRSAQHPVKSLENATLGKAVLLQQIINQAKETLKSYAFYSVEKYFNLTEDYKAEQAMANVQSVMSHAISGGMTIAGGVAVGGPIGGLIAGAGWILSEILAAKKAWDRQNIELTTMNMQSNFQQVRLGLIDNGRGTLN